MIATDLISSADLRDCWTDRQLATLANARHRERMAEAVAERNVKISELENRIGELEYELEQARNND